MSDSRAVLDPKIQESLVLRGDLSGLAPEQKKQFVNRTTRTAIADLNLTYLAIVSNP